MSNIYWEEKSREPGLSEDFIRKNADNVCWLNISYHQKLSENFIREFQDKVSWKSISFAQELSEDFIQEFQDEVDWRDISTYQDLSEDFIRKHQNKVNWSEISRTQNLSENFIREFKDKIDWQWSELYKNLSEDFLVEFQDKVSFDLLFIHKSLSEKTLYEYADWFVANQRYLWDILIYQNLSEDFIRDFQDEVDWDYISKYQQLSEDFIREFKNEVDWYFMSIYQKLSEGFIQEFNLVIPDTCWLYKTTEWKESYIRENTNYSIEDGIIIAYKSTAKGGYSIHNLQYKYEIGKEYTSRADFNSNIPNSFGLSAWTRENALRYYSEGKLFKVGIKPEDLACVTQGGKKLRATKIKILEEINF